MNKGLELIEAHHLFALEPAELDVLVHPQSVVHGLVEFRDGSVLAQLGAPDMRIPIAHCLAWPERIDGPAPRLDLARDRHAHLRGAGSEPVPGARARPRALETGGAAPTILNAANEVAVAAFVAGRLGFAGIAALVEATLKRAAASPRSRATASAGHRCDEALAVDAMIGRSAGAAIAAISAVNCRQRGVVDSAVRTSLDSVTTG